MKMEEVIFRAIAKKITWRQAVDVLGISHSTVSHWMRKYETRGYDPRFWKGGGNKSSLDIVRLSKAEKILSFYWQRHSRLSIRCFHQRLIREHDIRVSYAWLKLALEGAGLVSLGPKSSRKSMARSAA